MTAEAESTSELNPLIFHLITFKVSLDRASDLQKKMKLATFDGPFEENPGLPEIPRNESPVPAFNSLWKPKFDSLRSLAVSIHDMKELDDLQWSKRLAHLKIRLWKWHGVVDIVKTLVIISKRCILETLSVVIDCDFNQYHSTCPPADDPPGTLIKGNITSLCLANIAWPEYLIRACCPSMRKDWQCLLICEDNKMQRTNSPSVQHDQAKLMSCLTHMTLYTLCLPDKWSLLMDFYVLRHLSIDLTNVPEFNNPLQLAKNSWTCKNLFILQVSCSNSNVLRNFTRWFNAHHNTSLPQLSCLTVELTGTLAIAHPHEKINSTPMFDAAISLLGSEPKTKLYQLIIFDAGLREEYKADSGFLFVIDSKQKEFEILQLVGQSLCVFWFLKQPNWTQTKDGVFYPGKLFAKLESNWYHRKSWIVVCFVVSVAKVKPSWFGASIPLVLTLFQLLGFCDHEPGDFSHLFGKEALREQIWRFADTRYMSNVLAQHYVSQVKFNLKRKIII
jgi:hypothetical protein